MLENDPNNTKPHQKHFKEFCVFRDGVSEQSLKEDDLFVGVKIVKTEEPYKFEPRIFFPRGYRPDSSLSVEEKDTELKADFFRLLSIISDTLEQNVFPDDEKDDKKIDFPIHAFFSVLQYHLDYGYFVETEHIYKKGHSGKINWSKTIKNIKPQVIQDEDGRYNLVYLDLIARQTNYKEDNLITLIHKFCTYEAAKTVGPLLGISEDDLEMPEIQFDYELFAETLKDKIASTFNDKFLELFQSMLAVVNYMDNKENRAGDGSEISFGFEKFDHAWEMMVDRIFGTVSINEKRANYNPSLKLVAENNQTSEGNDYQEEVGRNAEYKRSTLRPDTIMVRGQDTFVLDSKYYKYGLTGFNSHLPGAESVCKQMAYAEYVEMRLKEIPAFAGMTSHGVYNAFIMPYCADAGKWDEIALAPPRNDDSLYKMCRVGYIYGDWKNRQMPYHKIACILLDMKSVMRNYSANLDAQKALVDLILHLGA